VINALRLISSFWLRARHTFQPGYVFALLFFFITFNTHAENTAADNHAIILLYHHVSESGPATTSVTPKRFREHLQYLKDNGYQVWPMQKVLDAVFTDKAMPDKVITITFDDSYRSIYTNALPILKEFDYPFTVFIDTKAVSEEHPAKNPLRPSWHDLKELQANGGTIANHSHSHTHFPQRMKNETEKEWENRIRNEITTAQQLLEKHLGKTPNWFAYPFGEYDEKSTAIVAGLNLWGFGQHSGPIGPLSDKLALPRFAVAGQYSAMPGFKQKVSTRPLPVIRLEQPVQPMPANKIAPVANVYLQKGNYSLKAMNCFSHGGETAAIKIISDDHFTVQAKRALPKGRSRYNCTMPAGEDGKNRFYWLSIPWIVN
jgi:biofilm PGA synthesis lipoprotein PgaB